MALIDIIGRLKAAQYTGSNSADLLAGMQVMCNNGVSPYFSADIVAGQTNSSQCTINLRDNTNAIVSTFVFPVNTWTLFAATGVQGSEMPADLFGALYASWTEMINTIGSTTAFSAAVAAASASNSGAFGSYPSLTVNGLSNANFDVPIRPMMKANTFTAVPVLTGTSSLLGSLSITGLTAGAVGSGAKLSTVIDGVTWYDRVRVNVANSGVVQLTGAALLVHVSP